jgi:hypothetical protein
MSNLTYISTRKGVTVATRDCCCYLNSSVFTFLCDDVKMMRIRRWGFELHGRAAMSLRRERAEGRLKPQRQWRKEPGKIKPQIWRYERRGSRWVQESYGRPGVNQAALISVNLCLFLLLAVKKLQLYLHACNRANAGGTAHVNEAKHSLSPTMEKWDRKSSANRCFRIIPKGKGWWNWFMLRIQLVLILFFLIYRA